jgi:uncharacterized membrane protein
MQTAYTWTPVIVVHAALAGVAVVLGAGILWGRKGQRMHRAVGWIWVLLMASVAGISFAIHRPDGFSWIHGLSVFTLVSLTVGVFLARTHRVRAHRQHMIALYVGALLITGLFTLLPGRLLGQWFWGWVLG